MARSMLEYVMVAGEPVHVRHFAHLPSHQRPKSFCPHCGGTVTMKLGDVNAYHAAHPTAGGCPLASGGEGARHSNAKNNLKEFLESCTQPLQLRQNCARGLECGPATKVSTWDVRWDEVQAEQRVGGVKPDLRLLLNGEVVGAVEVYSTHAVDDEKADKLRCLGVPWIEVDVDWALGPLFGGDFVPIRNWTEGRFVCDGCRNVLVRRPATAALGTLFHLSIVTPRGVDVIFIDRLEAGRPGNTRCLMWPRSLGSESGIDIPDPSLGESSWQVIDGQCRRLIGSQFVIGDDALLLLELAPFWGPWGQRFKMKGMLDATGPARPLKAVRRGR